MGGDIIALDSSVAYILGKIGSKLSLRMESIDGPRVQSRHLTGLEYACSIAFSDVETPGMWYLSSEAATFLRLK